MFEQLTAKSAILRKKLTNIRYYLERAEKARREADEVIDSGDHLIALQDLVEVEKYIKAIRPYVEQEEQEEKL